MTSPWEPFSIYNTLGSWPAQTREASHSFTPNALNQYAAIDTTRTPTYDLSGNMVDDGAGRTFSFDSENRLMSGTKSPDAWFEYDYDPFGRRVMKFVEVGNMDTETRYVYDGPHCIAETDLSGAIQRKFIYGPGIDEPLMMIVVDDYYQTETKYYYHRDALGNVMSLSDANGNIVEGYTYSAFGIATVNRSAGTDGDWLTPDGTTSDKSAKGNPYMFTGRRYDPESGLYYYRARYYDATLGRFISADPISYAGGINLQAYCNNNPVNFRDPMGLDWLGGGGFGDKRDELADGGPAGGGAGGPLNPINIFHGGSGQWESAAEQDKDTTGNHHNDDPPPSGLGLPNPIEILHGGTGYQWQEYLENQPEPESGTFAYMMNQNWDTGEFFGAMAGGAAGGVYFLGGSGVVIGVVGGTVVYVVSTTVTSIWHAATTPNGVEIKVDE